MRSTIYLSGSDAFPRVKVGIGHKPEKWDLADFVLSEFTKDERKVIDETASRVVEATKLIVSGGIDKAMNLYN